MSVMMLDVGGGTDVKSVEGEACLLLLLFLPRLEPGNISAHLIDHDSESHSSQPTFNSRMSKTLSLKVFTVFC